MRPWRNMPNETVVSAEYNNLGDGHLKTRIISGVVAGILMLAVLLLLPPLALNIAMCFICTVAAWELLSAVGLLSNKTLTVGALLFAASMPFYSLAKDIPLFIIVSAAFAFFLFVMQLSHHKDLPVEKTGTVFFFITVLVGSLSCVAHIRTAGIREDTQDGLFYVFLVLIVAWMSDVGAYFSGVLFGKHKMCPNISPKKTIEGLIGGIVFSVLCCLGAAVVYQHFFLKDAATVCLWQVVLLAMVGAPMSVMGDLFASVIKRQHNIKDFGNIMPGHGGVMDRFDSVIPVVAMFYLVIQWLPLVYAA